MFDQKLRFKKTEDDNEVFAKAKEDAKQSSQKMAPKQQMKKDDSKAPFSSNMSSIHAKAKDADAPAPKKPVAAAPPAADPKKEENVLLFDSSDINKDQFSRISE